MRKKVVPGDKVLYAYEKMGLLTSSDEVALCEVITVFTTKAGKRPWQYKRCYVLWDFEDNCKRTALASECVYLSDEATKKLMELEADAMANKKKKKKEGMVYL